MYYTACDTVHTKTAKTPPRERKTPKMEVWRGFGVVVGCLPSPAMPLWRAVRLSDAFLWCVCGAVWVWCFCRVREASVISYCGMGVT